MDDIYAELSRTPLKLFNTASRKKEVFKPAKDNHVLMYTCGPTVYNFAHIGNFRTYVFEDLLRRTIKFFGMKLTQVMNLTDVDDKTIKGAIQKGISLNDFTRPYIEAFFDDIKTLNMEPAEQYPAATDYIPQMIEMIQGLIDKKVAYLGGDDSVYFSIRAFPHYGCLSHLNLDDLKAGSSGVSADEYEKDNISDFVLWKAYQPDRDGNIYWESPFGKGRPGWHLECSTMAMKLLGKTIDMHVGGVDNMFPHHENEIAQSEAYSGTTFSRHWMHSEHLVVDNKKMSKSLGNFYTLRDLLNKGYTGIEVRYMLMQTHYKTQLNFTFQGLDAVRVSLQRLNDFVLRMLELSKMESHNNHHAIDTVTPLLQKTLKAFTEALSDDLNISVALAAIFELVREANGMTDNGEVGPKEAQQILVFMRRINEVLGVLTFEKEEDSIPQELQDALTQRLQARKDKNWVLADQLRDFIHEKGYMIEDTVHGARLKKR